MQPPGKGRKKVYIFGPGHMTKMATMPIYGKNLKKSSSPEPLQADCQPGRVAQSVGHLTRKSGVLGSIPGLATCFRFSFRFFKKGSCQLLAKVCA